MSFGVESSSRYMLQEEHLLTVDKDAISKFISSAGMLRNTHPDGQGIGLVTRTYTGHNSSDLPFIFLSIVVRYRPLPPDRKSRSLAPSHSTVVVCP